MHSLPTLGDQLTIQFNCSLFCLLLIGVSSTAGVIRLDDNANLRVAGISQYYTECTVRQKHVVIPQL